MWTEFREVLTTRMYSNYQTRLVGRVYSIFLYFWCFCRQDWSLTGICWCIIRLLTCKDIILVHTTLYRLWTWNFWVQLPYHANLLMSWLLSNGCSVQTEAPPPRKQRNNRYLRWTTRMNRILTNVLLDQYATNNHSPNGWKADAYTAIIIATKEKCDVTPTKLNIISHLKLEIIITKLSIKA